MAKVVCVLYDDPIDGYPSRYARDDLPKIDHYPGGQTTPTPRASWACANTWRTRGGGVR
jgi:formate dehydrogenase